MTLITSVITSKTVNVTPVECHSLFTEDHLEQRKNSRKLSFHIQRFHPRHGVYEIDSNVLFAFAICFRNKIK